MVPEELKMVLGWWKKQTERLSKANKTVCLQIIHKGAAIKSVGKLIVP